MQGVCSWTHKGTGKTCETPKVDIWRFRDGKAIEFYELFDTAAAFAAATPDK
jgi:ketosteroid isomerase-like protein